MLDESTVLHVGMPSAKLMPLERLLCLSGSLWCVLEEERSSGSCAYLTAAGCLLLQVLRVPMPESELQLFLRCARQLIGCKYDIARYSDADS